MVVGGNPGPDPTDRASSGTRRHRRTECVDIPIALDITATNLHDRWARLLGQAIKGRDAWGANYVSSEPDSAGPVPCP